MAPNEDYHDIVDQLEKEGEWEVHRVPEPYVEVKNKYGRIKKIPVETTWHHKSCGQCGHIPGYSTSIFWINRQLGLDYHDPTDQTSCTACSVGNTHDELHENCIECGEGTSRSEPETVCQPCVLDTYQPQECRNDIRETYRRIRHFSGRYARPSED